MQPNLFRRKSLNAVRRYVRNLFFRLEIKCRKLIRMSEGEFIKNIVQQSASNVFAECVNEWEFVADVTRGTCISGEQFDYDGAIIRNRETPARFMYKMCSMWV